MTTAQRVFHQVEIPTDFEAIHVLLHDILQHLPAFGYDENAHFAVRLALDEALANAYDHGNLRRPELKIRVSYEITHARIKVVVEDQGDGFDHRRVDDPREDAALDRTHGRGIFLIQQFMSEVRFNERGSQITLVYRRDKPGLSGWPGLKIWESGGATILDIPAELPACYAYVIGVCLEDLVETGHRRLALNLTQREHWEPQLMAEIVETAGKRLARGVRLIAVGAHPARGAARVPGLEWHRDLPSALAALSDPESRGDTP